MMQVRTRVRTDARVDITCQFSATSTKDPLLGYITFHWAEDFRVPRHVSHDPGIPVEALVPEKVGPIAAWIVRQIARDHPEWFLS